MEVLNGRTSFNTYVKLLWFLVVYALYKLVLGLARLAMTDVQPPDCDLIRFLA